MVKKKKDTELSEPIAEFTEMDRDSPPQPYVSDPAPVLAKRTKKSVVQVKPAKRVNFDRYARSKGFRITHVPGMRAFAKNPNMLRTIEEWDKFFEGY